MADTITNTEEKNITQKDEAIKPQVEEYSIDKNRYHSVKYATTKDEISGQYVININNPLTRFDTSISKAFGVTDKVSGDSNKLYAVVIDKRYPIRLSEINKLVESTQENFANIIAAQIIPLSLGKGRFLTVVVEKPGGATLAEYMEINGSITEDIAAKKIIPQINNAISFLARKAIVHGRINLNNIYIDASGKITVGECISEVCGCSQPIIYENANRAAAFYMGRGDGLIAKTDYYALGVLISIMLRGKNIADGVPDSAILDAKLSESTYKVLTDGLELSPRITDFLRGVLNDDKKEMWDTSQVDDWIKGRRFNLLAQGKVVDAGRPLSFNDKKYWNKKSLAHDFYLNWDDAKKFVRGDTLVRWIERSVGDTDMSEKMEIFANRIGGGEPGSSFDKDDELLAQYILLLDPEGPIRLRNFSSTVGGVATLLADSYAHNKQHYQESIANIMGFSLISYIDVGKAGIDEVSNEHEAILIIQRCRDLFRKVGMGFGLERCLYELNPTIPCQSPAVFDYVSFVLSDLLKILDGNEGPVGVIDRNMAAFISTRLELPLQIRVPSLARFPDFATNVNIQSLALLSLAQQTSGVRSLPRLSEKIVNSLQNVVGEFHSKFVRAELVEGLAEVAKKGSLSIILNVISDTKFLVRDRLGFRRAVTKYSNNAAHIAKLSNRKAVNNMGYRYGLQLAVLFSFFMTTVVVIVLMIKVF